jgi:tetratricopeptide (TPR) repeat protein
MSGSFSSSRVPRTVGTVVIITLAAACGADESGRKTVAVDVIPSAEASVVPTTSTATTAAVADATPVTDSSGITYAAAEAAYSGKKYAEAKEMFESIVSRNPANGWNYYMLALSAWKSGDRVSAEGAFNAALERDPKHLKSHLNLARVLIEDGRTKEALAHAERVIQLDSTSLDGYRLLGQIHGELKNLELSLIAYEKAIALHPRDAWSMNNMAFLLIQSGRHEEALAPLALATTIEPRNPVLQNNLGMALELTGRFTQATGAYKTAISFESGYEKAAASLARIAGRVDDPSVMPIDLKTLAESYAAKIVR